MATPFWYTACRKEMAMAKAAGLRKSEVTPSIHKAKRDLEECEISEGYMIGGYHIAFVYSVASRVVDALLCTHIACSNRGLGSAPLLATILLLTARTKVRN